MGSPDRAGYLFPPKGPSHSHNGSTESAPGRKRVGFISDSPPEDAPSSSRAPNESHDNRSTNHHTNGSTNGSDVSHERLSEEIHKAFGQPYIPKPRPAIRRAERTPSTEFNLGDEEDTDKKRSGLAAQKRAAALSKSVGTYSASAPTSRRNSNEELFESGRPTIEMKNISEADRHSIEAESTDDDMDEDAQNRRKEFLNQADQILRETLRRQPDMLVDDLWHAQATPLASGQTTPRNDMEIDDEHVPRPAKFRTSVLGTLLKASQALPVPALPKNRLQLPSSSNGRNSRSFMHGRNPSSQSLTFSTASTEASPSSSPERSGTMTPPNPSRPWYSKSANNSNHSISRLIETSSMLAVPAQQDYSHEMEEVYKKSQTPKKPSRPGLGKRTVSNNSITSTISKMTKAARKKEYKIKLHLAGTLARQNYLRKLCKALMMYGAPTHRLEEYMNMSARVLEIEAQFLYMPGCMIIAFDDSSVHTSEVKLVRCNQGVDLGKLQDVHEIYKDVVHDRINVEEATPRLEAIMSRKPKYSVWLRVPIYGLASATVGPFAFQARPIDLPFCFLLGCILGWLQLIVAPQNELISNVFEISAAVITSFIARGLGSIKKDGKEIFCFSAMAQSSIALILPGFTVLSASLELQSRHIVAGSVRMVYAIIYSLFLGFGITIGTVLFGIIHRDATSETTCQNPMNSRWNYPFVLCFSLCLIVINQGKIKQIPAMVTISLIGYAVSFNSSLYFKYNSQISSTLGALAIGISANLHARFGRHIENFSLDRYETTFRPRWMRFRRRWLRNNRTQKQKTEHDWIPQSEHAHPTPPDTSYSSSDTSPTHGASTAHGAPYSRNSSTSTLPYVPRVRRIGFGLAAAAMLPAIFVQVPSGLSVSGSLVAGLMSADQITRNTSNATTVSSSDPAGSAINNVALNVGFSVVQVAIGITVGLFLAALMVYPLGKRRSGLFSF